MKKNKTGALPSFSKGHSKYGKLIKIIEENVMPP